MKNADLSGGAPRGCGCTIMGVAGGAGRDGDVWLFSSSDNHYLDGPRKPVMLSIAASGKRYVHTPCLVREGSGFRNLGSDRGLTENGFAWTRSWVVPGDRPAPKGFGGREWFVALAENCGGVDDALTFLRETPRAGGAQGNFLFADSAGNLACVEVGFSRAEIVFRAGPAKSAIVARANRFLSEGMRGMDDSARVNPVYYSTSAARESRAGELLARHAAAGGAGFAEGMVILADTAGFSPENQDTHGPSICSLGREHGTVSAEIFAPRESCFWYAYGWPVSKFPAGAPLALCGDNANSWRAWLRFRPGEMEEPGYYSTWDGMLTPLGVRHLEKEGRGALTACP